MSQYINSLIKQIGQFTGEQLNECDVTAFNILGSKKYHSSLRYNTSVKLRSHTNEMFMQLWNVLIQRSEFCLIEAELCHDMRQAMTYEAMLLIGHSRTNSNLNQNTI